MYVSQSIYAHRVHNLSAGAISFLVFVQCCSHNPPGCVGNIPIKSCFFWLVGAPFLLTNPHDSQLSSVQNLIAVWLYGVRLSFIHWGLSWIATIHELGNPFHQLAPRNDISGFEHCSNQWQSIEKKHVLIHSDHHLFFCFIDINMSLTCFSPR